MAKKTILCVKMVILVTLTNILIGMSLSNRWIDTPRQDLDKDSQNRKIEQTNINQSKYKEFKHSDTKMNGKIELGNIKDPPNKHFLRKSEISERNGKVEVRHIHTEIIYQNDWNTNNSSNQKSKHQEGLKWVKEYKLSKIKTEAILWRENFKEIWNKTSKKIHQNDTKRSIENKKLYKEHRLYPVQGIFENKKEIVTNSTQKTEKSENFKISKFQNFNGYCSPPK
jgi:hypothetical protein